MDSVRMAQKLTVCYGAAIGLEKACCLEATRHTGTIGGQFMMLHGIALSSVSYQMPK